MTILFLTKEFPYPVNSGARMRTRHYLNGLCRAGQVILVCGGQVPDNGQSLLDADTQGQARLYSSGETLGNHISLPGRIRALLSLLPCAVSARVSFPLKETARRAARESGCDVIVCDGIHMALNVPMEIPCRKILDEHNVESTIIGRFFNTARNPLVKIYTLMEWLKFRRFEDRVWKQFDEIHVCSDVDKGQVEKRCGHDRVCVVPNGVNSRDTILNSATQGASQGNKDFCLVYSGMMGWHPNNDAALYFLRKIFPLVKQKLASGGSEPAPVRFMIVGKDPSPAVKALAQKDPAVTVTGFVEDVRPLVEQADVVVVPLRIGSGTRLKILEAMAMGRPIVSTSIGCEGLNVDDGGHLLIADDPDAFAERVVRLLRDPVLRARMSQAGRRLVEEKYDWKKIEESLAGRVTRPQGE